MILKGKYLETSDNVGIRWKRYQLSSVALKKSVIFVVHRHLHFGTYNASLYNLVIDSTKCGNEEFR